MSTNLQNIGVTSAATKLVAMPEIGELVLSHSEYFSPSADAGPQGYPGDDLPDWPRMISNFGPAQQGLEEAVRAE